MDQESITTELKSVNDHGSVEKSGRGTESKQEINASHKLEFLGMKPTR